MLTRNCPPSKEFCFSATKRTFRRREWRIAQGLLSLPPQFPFALIRVYWRLKVFVPIFHLPVRHLVRHSAVRRRKLRRGATTDVSPGNLWLNSLASDFSTFRSQHSREAPWTATAVTSFLAREHPVPVIARCARPALHESAFWPSRVSRFPLVAGWLPPSDPRLGRRQRAGNPAPHLESKPPIGRSSRRCPRQTVVMYNCLSSAKMQPTYSIFYQPVSPVR